MHGSSFPGSVGVCWVNGRLVDTSETPIASNDHAVVVGDSVFETMKVIDGTAFALSRHLQRLRHSSDGMAMNPPNEKQTREAVKAVLNADPRAGKLRITWSSGVGPLSSVRGEGPGTLIVATETVPVWPLAETIHIIPWRRNEYSAIAGLKTTSYAENVRALLAAQELGCSEALFLNTAGHICEGTSTNIFLVLGHELVTPPLSSGCLSGITRQLLLEEMDVIQRPIDPTEITNASEAFLTSSLRDISPIERIDDFLLTPTPGPITAQAKNAFAYLCEKTLDP